MLKWWLELAVGGTVWDGSGLGIRIRIRVRGRVRVRVGGMG